MSTIFWPPSMCEVKDWLYMIWDLWHPCKHGDYIRDSNFVVFVIYSYEFSSTVNLRLHGFIFWEILGLENGVRFHGSHFGPPTPKIRVTVSPKLFVSLASNFMSVHFSWDRTFDGNFRKIEDLRAWPFGDITWNDPNGNCVMTTYTATCISSCKQNKKKALCKLSDHVIDLLTMG